MLLTRACRLLMSDAASSIGTNGTNGSSSSSSCCQHDS